MDYKDTPRNRVANLVMEYALKYGITYIEAETIFRQATTHALSDLDDVTGLNAVIVVTVVTANS